MEIKDSGKRQEFKTGAVRDSEENKGRYDLLPCYAISLLAKHFEGGAKKYGDSNWKKGIPLKRYLDSMLRHIFKFMAGAKDEPHLIAAIWNGMCLIETKKMIDEGILPKELDNLDTSIFGNPNNPNFE